MNCSANGAVAVTCASRLYEGSGSNKDLDASGTKAFTVPAGQSKTFPPFKIENDGCYVELVITVSTQTIK